MRLLLYTRKECHLCEVMKAVIAEVRSTQPFDLDEVDVDTSAELVEKYGEQVPVLFVNDRKAFKYDVTAQELRARLAREH